mmetsp:Transcript_10656/g.29912  ORF Transcript_10656/g.29912 Transcript_10656/m.29912 type:complete len:213 (-) Transcript_10656:2782-3420(-)
MVVHRCATLVDVLKLVVILALRPFNCRANTLDMLPKFPCPLRRGVGKERVQLRQLQGEAEDGENTLRFEGWELPPLPPPDSLRARRRFALHVQVQGANKRARQRLGVGYERLGSKGLAEGKNCFKQSEGVAVEEGSGSCYPTGVEDVRKGDGTALIGEAPHKVHQQVLRQTNILLGEKVRHDITEEHSPPVCVIQRAPLVASIRSQRSQIHC